MKVLVIGANGQIGKKVVRKLIESNHLPKAMVRKKEQMEQFKEIGSDVILADLEKDISHAFEDVDAVIFTAGSGGGTSKEMTKVIDREGAKKAIEEAQHHNANRFIMVSAFGTDLPENWPEAMTHYYKAKSVADNYLKETYLDYTILKPGRLSDEVGKGKIELGERTEQRSGSITREDVATVIVKILDVEASKRKSYELLQGDTPIIDVLEEL